MVDLANPAIAAWENFYVIVGSSAAALIGIQFIVITLASDMRTHPTPESISAFGTPTVVHLAGALLVSALMSVPWVSLFPASIAIALCGFGGLVYGVFVIHRAHRQTFYKPVWDDWFWYTLLPCSLYAALVWAAFLLRTRTSLGLFLTGAAAFGLLLIAIHNAWDSVTHLIVTRAHDDPSHDRNRSKR